MVIAHLLKMYTLQAYDGSIVVEVELLERFPTDPPDVPTLSDVLIVLQSLVNTGQFYVSYIYLLTTTIIINYYI